MISKIYPYALLQSLRDILYIIPEREIIKCNASRDSLDSARANGDYKSRVVKRLETARNFYFELHTQYAFTVPVLIHMYRSF